MNQPSSGFHPQSCHKQRSKDHLRAKARGQAAVDTVWTQTALAQQPPTSEWALVPNGELGGCAPRADRCVTPTMMSLSHGMSPTKFKLFFY